jgi:hypothetical protein
VVARHVVWAVASHVTRSVVVKELSAEDSWLLVSKQKCGSEHHKQLISSARDGCRHQALLMMINCCDF